jgi:transcription initiation factor TFIIB
MRRCNGAPSTVSLHDNGLGSTIRYSDTSKKSNTTQLRRMRTWHRRARIKNKKERNLKEGLSQVRAVTGRLSLGAAVRDRAAAIFRKGHMDHSLTCGRSIEQIAGAAVYAATRELNLGRRPEEIAKVLRLFESDLDGEMDVVDAVRSGYSCLCRDLELTIAPPSPVEYIPKTASRLKMSEETYHRALSIAQTVEGTQEIVGKAPSGVAGACLFLGSQATGEYVNQGEIARQVNRSTPAVRSSAESIAPIVVEQGLLTPKMVGEKSAVGKALVNAGYSLEESDGANSHNEQSTDEDASARPELTLPRATAVAESNGMGGKNTHLAD